MTAEDMKIKKIIKHYILGESIKEIELNRILDKVAKKSSLTDREMRFLELYQTTREEEIKDFLLLSRHSAAVRIQTLIESGKKVICDLTDRDGKIGLLITSAECSIEEEECILKLKGGQNASMKDSFLYNIGYDMKRDRYSLTEHDEYYEKTEIDNEGN
jgi:hypothetical protein